MRRKPIPEAPAEVIPDPAPDTRPVPNWRPIAEAPTDGTLIWTYTAAAHGMPAFQGPCAYHPDAGFTTDELRPVTHWLPLKEVYLRPPLDEIDIKMLTLYRSLPEEAKPAFRKAVEALAAFHKAVDGAALTQPPSG